MQISLSSFTDWIEATDEHAAERLTLAGRAQRLLADEEPSSCDIRRKAAAGLERWRYQLLKQHPGTLSARDRELADALDLAANRLAGHGPRPPRSPRTAIRDAALDTGAIAAAKACLDPKVSLEDLTLRAREITRENFKVPSAAPGAYWRMLLYAPIYLSSHCINYCTYCGFRYPNAIPRKHLTFQESLREEEILRSRGFRHILLVAGDFPSLTTTDYFVRILRELAARGVAPGIEIAAQSTESYAAMVAAGARAMTLYQETYNEELYARYHPRGSKVSFDWRLESFDRAADAGVERLGLGILLGLADPRDDLLAMLRHALYLQTRYPSLSLAFSLPRIHEAPSGFKPPYPVDDATFVRLYCALRIAFPNAELVLSTREAAPLRDCLARICITQISAGSSTVPGGYGTSTQDPCGAQFPVCDHRQPAEMAGWLQDQGFHVVWELAKD
jgi:2-iminoacetate synthase